MCVPTGKTDLMSPQAQVRYKEAVGEDLKIPMPVQPRDDSYIKPKGATVRLSDGRMVTKESADKLQQMLKNRGV